MVPKQKSCSSVEAGKRAVGISCLTCPRGADGAGWYQQGSSWAGPASALAPAATAVLQCTSTNTSIAARSLGYFSFLDGTSQEGQMFHHGQETEKCCPDVNWQSTPHAQQPHSVDLWKMRNAAPKGQLEVYNTKKEDVAAQMDPYFNVCTVVGLRLLYAK